MFDRRVRLGRRTVYAQGLFALHVDLPELSRVIRPGQFAMLGVPDRAIPFLRRAFSVANTSSSGECEFLVKTMGAGTSCLERLPAGSELSILAPLGNAFATDDLSASDRVAIVAGGVGIAPFPLLLKDLAIRGIEADVYFGGRTAAELAYQAAIAPLTTGELFLATDDGSAGNPGRITAVLEKHLGAGRTYRRLYACGPTPMFRTLGHIVATHNVQAEFSTEAPMGCGFGVCLACVLPRPGGGYLISCQEGPILSPSRIDWSRT